MKVSVEFAEDEGLIPRPDIYMRRGLQVYLADNETILRRTRERNLKYNVDENYCVEVSDPHGRRLKHV